MTENERRKYNEIDILIRKNETLKDEIAELQRKNSELEALLKRTFEHAEKCFVALMNGNISIESKARADREFQMIQIEKIEIAKSEAYKEFAERLKMLTCYTYRCEYSIDDEEIENKVKSAIDNLLTELTKQEKNDFKE